MKEQNIVLWVLLFASCTIPVDNSGRSWSSGDRDFLLEHLSTSIHDVLNAADAADLQQWGWRPDSTAWSVAMVIEHLITHDELFYREVRVLTALPEPPAVSDSLFSSDDEILSYGIRTEQNMGNAPDYLAPMGRWCSKEDAVTAYKQIRARLIGFVQTTEKDLRHFYTTSGRGPTVYRDLHQLLLISIAHTRRHTEQIKRILSTQPPK